METVYARRRSALMELIGPKAVAIVGGPTHAHRNSDVEYRYRQSSDLLFLTGFAEPESVAVLAPGRPQPFTLFVRPRDPERETWTGRRAGGEGASAKFGAQAAFDIAKLPAELTKILDGADEVHTLLGEDAALDAQLQKSIGELRAGERRGLTAPTKMCDLRATLHRMRLIKDEHGLAQLRRAAEITHEAHVAAMRAARAGVFEYEIEALIDYTFRRRGGLPGYGTIAGGGANATILHYVDNSEPLKQGELLLVDAGCEFGSYTADVTRTYPVGARFSPAQRRLYEIVLDAEKRCIAAVKPGATVQGIHELAVQILTEGLVRLGLLSGEPEALIESGAYRRFYMHRTSHWLGMDVHDVGGYVVDGQPRPLAPGMVLTVEPGLYIPADATDVAEEYRGIGIRIEDDILCTQSGDAPEILTLAIPKEIEELEALTTA